MRDHLAELDALATQWRRATATRDRLQEQIRATALHALTAGVEPGDVYRHTPLSAVWLRAQARAAGIPPGTPGPKPTRR